MHKHLLDASGPGVVAAYLANRFLEVTTPTLVWLGAAAALVWYGIRFYEYFKNGRID